MYVLVESALCFRECLKAQVDKAAQAAMTAAAAAAATAAATGCSGEAAAPLPPRGKPTTPPRLHSSSTRTRASTAAAVPAHIREQQQQRFSSATSTASSSDGNATTVRRHSATSAICCARPYRSVAPTRLCSRRPPAPLRTRPLAKAEVVAASSRLSAHVRTHTCCSVRSALSCRVLRLSQSVRHRSARSCRRCPLASAFCCCSVPELSGSRCMTDLSLLCRTARPSVGALVRAPVMNIELLTHHHPSLAQFGGRRGNLACRSSNNS